MTKTNYIKIAKKASSIQISELRKINKVFAMMTDAMMTDGLTEENTHPGAMRALKELGIWKTRKGTVPVTYP